MSDSVKLAKRLLAIRETIAKADEDYVYDPKHVNRPHEGGNWHKTDKGWSRKEVKKGKGTEEESPKNKNLAEQPKRTDISVLDDPNVSADDIRAIDHVESHDDEMRIINHPKTPDDMLRRYVTQWDGYEPSEGDKSVTGDNPYDMFMEEMKAISSHPNVSKETLMEMSKFKNPQVREWAKIPKQGPVSKFKSMKLQDKINLAGSKDISSEDLDELSRDKEQKVRWNVANNSRTSPETLKNMYDAIEDVFEDDTAEAISMNPNAPKDVQVGLARSGITSGIHNPNAAPEALHEILGTMEDHESYDSYYQVLKNKNVSSKDVDWVADKYMERDTDVDEQDNMPYFQENALAVITHPNATVKTIAKLTMAHDKTVARAARQTLKAKNFPTPKR